MQVFILMTKKEQLVYKNFDDGKFDFNKLSLFLDKHYLQTKISSNYLNDFILQSVYQVKGGQHTSDFNPIYQKLEQEFNPTHKKSDLDIFFSMVSGSSSITHVDSYRVYILNLVGKIVYKLDTGLFELNTGDLLIIPQGTTHKAMGLTPRITLSYALY